MDEYDVRDSLAEVEDPDLGRDVVPLGPANSIESQRDVAHVSLALGAPYSPAESAIDDRVRHVLADRGLEADLPAHRGGRRSRALRPGAGPTAVPG